MIQITSLLCMLLGICLVLFFSFAHSAAARIAYADTQEAARASAPDGSKDTNYTLFPELTDITAISLYTPERSFQFRRDDTGSVCVNGQQADSDIYNTLVSQIARLPVDEQPPFEADNAQLMLTLEVTTGGCKHTARFYTDGLSGEDARIVSGPDNAPRYHRTDGWRVGTLMMTCEGTRIQDECGNEMPATFVNPPH